METKKKIAMWSGLILVFLVPICLFLYNKFVDKPSEILTTINNGGSGVILVVDVNCDTCGEVGDILKDNNVEYYELEKFNTEEFSNVMRLIDLDSRYVKAPSLITIVDGELYSYLLEIDNKAELLAFIKNYHLGETE